MQENYSTYKIPSYARAEVYDFSGDNFRAAYLELIRISEEITECRTQELSKNY